MDVISPSQGNASMSDRNLSEYVSIARVAVCLAVLVVMLIRRLTSAFPALIGYLAVTSLGGTVTIALVYFRDQLNIPERIAYFAFFCSFWVVQVVGLFLIVLLIKGIFSEAMRPFSGLQRIGKLVFRWVGVVSFVVAVALAAGPNLFTKSLTTLAVLQQLIAQLQQGINVLILCLLIFVCFAIRPLGLTFRSHVFGVALGLGIASCIQLVQAAWLATVGASSMYSPVYAFGTLGMCAAVLVWGIYFALPEPERRMILLPTTSPFFLWNRISEILGDDPGNVAVAGFTPNMLAAGEIEMLTAITSQEAAAARDREAMETSESDSAFPELPAPRKASLALSI